MKEIQEDYNFSLFTGFALYLSCPVASVEMFEFVTPDVALRHKAGSQWFYVPAQKCGVCPLGYGQLLKIFYSIIQLIVCSRSS